MCDVSPPLSDAIRVLSVDDQNTVDLTEISPPRVDEFAVERAESAGEALDHIEDSTVECVVSAYDLPDSDGIEFLETVREEYPDLPFVLYGADDSEEVAGEAISAGATDYCSRPDDPEQLTVLTNRITNAVERVRSKQVLRERNQALHRYERMVNSMHEAACIYDADGRFELVNEYLADWYGTTPDELEGKRSELIPHIRAEKPGDPYRELLEGERDEIRGIIDGDFPNHGHAFLEYRLTPIEVDGTVEGVVGVARDATERRERGRELERTNELFSTLFETLSAGIIIEDADRNVLAANERLLDLFEFSVPQTEFVGADCEQMAVEASDMFENPEEFVERIDQLIANRESVHDEELSLRDGRTFARSYRPIELPDGAGNLWVYRDITERINYEQQLREERQFVQSIFDALPDPLYAYDTDGFLLRWNEQFETVSGYDGETLGDRHVSEFVPEEELEHVLANFQTVLEDRRPVTTETLVETKDGDHIPFELTGGPLADADGNLRGLTGIGRDITERKEREYRLRALNETAQELMAADSQQAVCDIGVEAARDVLGLDANAIHLKGDRGDTLVPIAQTPAGNDLVGDPPILTEGDSIAWRVYESGDAHALDDVTSDPDVFNPETPVQSELFLPLGEHGILIATSETPEAFGEQDSVLGGILAGNIVAALEQVQQAAQLRERERELTRQNERLEEFANVVSHDLRNPLNVAKTRLELIQRDVDSDHIDPIERALDRMETLVDDLLTIAREGNQVSDTQPLSLETVSQGCWSNVDTEDATIRVDAGGTFRADRSRLQQLFENLFRNAVEHGGCDVTVTVGRLDDGFYVADDGPGITSGDHENVFDAGYSTDDTGTGFGLSIADQVADAHGWDIRVTDSDTGGARFEITGVEFVDETER